ncbi:MAG TPA: 4-hydroxybenzoate octaprenyltransferase [Burkholderiales bacterium]|nr:4-hydroxybenzoate octaprenyltransferase [Burkholderiales bacterium]
MADSPAGVVRPLTFTERLNAYERLMRLDQPIGWLLLLWPALWSLWLARRAIPELDVLVIFLLGVVLMRSAGCVINDCADRRFDPYVERTRNRPLAAGIVSLTEALALAAALLLAAFVLVLQLNWLTVLLSFAALAITVIYPFLKRFFVFPQAWLGVAFSFSIPMAYAAQLGHIPHIAWALMGATFFWIIAYDTEYAMVDRDDDLKLGLKSSAIVLGRFDVAGVMIAHALFLGGLTAIGRWQRLDAFYFAGLAIAAGLAIYQYWLIRGRDRNRCFRAFRNNNWVGLAVFVGLALDLHFRSGMLR